MDIEAKKTWAIGSVQLEELNKPKKPRKPDEDEDDEDWDDWDNVELWFFDYDFDTYGLE